MKHKNSSSNISRTVLANNFKLGTCMYLWRWKCSVHLHNYTYMYIQLESQHLEYCPYYWHGFQLRDIGRPVWTLSILLKFPIFSNSSWPVLMNIHFSEVMMPYPHYLSYASYMKLWKISMFCQMQVKVYPCIEIRNRIYNSSFILGGQKVRFALSYLKMRFSSFSVNEMCTKLWGHDIIICLPLSSSILFQVFF